MSRLRSAGPPLHEASADDAGATSRDRQAPLAGRSALIQWPRRIMARIAARAGVGPEIAWEAGWSFALKAANTGLGFLSAVLLARLLGAGGYGVYAYAYSLAWLLALPAQAGLPGLVTRETARGMAASDPGHVKGVWRWSGRMVGFISIAVVLVLGPLLILWQGGLGSEQGITIAWALPLVPLISLGNLRGAALRGLKKIVAGQLPEFLVRPAEFTLLIILFAYLLGRELSAPAAMALQSTAALAAFLVGAWLLLRSAPDSVRSARPVIAGRAWMLSMLVFAAISGFQVINKEISTLILGTFAAPDQIGIYRVAVQVSTLASFGLQAVNMVVAPRFADLYARGDMHKLQRLATGSARVVLIFNLALTALFLLLGRLFFNLVFGAEFVASFEPLMILLVGQAANSAAGSVGYLLNMTGHERETARGVGAAALLNVGLNLVLVPVWGIHGAAAATAISMVLWNAMLWRAVRRRLGINSLAFDLPMRAER